MSNRRERFARRAAEGRSTIWSIAQISFSGATGDFTVGRGEATKKIITRTPALVDVKSTLCGFRTFRDKKFIYAMVPADSDEVVLREDLGDLDEARWLVAKNGSGKRVDPWRVCYVGTMYLADPDDEGSFNLGEPLAYVAEYDMLDSVCGLMDALTVQGEDKDGCVVILDSHLRPGAKYHHPILRVEGWVTVPTGAVHLPPPPPVPKAAPEPATLPFKDF